MAVKINNKAKVQVFKQTPVTATLQQFSAILRGKRELYSARNLNKAYSKELSSIATRLNNEVRKEIAASFGGTLLSSRSKTGFRPSYAAVVDDRVETGKIKEVETKVVNNTLVAKRGLQLAGSSGISISKGRQTFLTGLQAKDGKVEEQTVDVATTRLFNRLEQAKDSDEIKRILSTKGEANTAIRQNIELNVQAIDIITTVSGKTESRRISFSWADIKKNKDIRLVVKKQGDEAISLQVYFTPALLTKAINDSNRVVVKSLEGQVSQALINAIADIGLIPTDKNIGEIRKLLVSQNSKYAIGYLTDVNIISQNSFTRKDVKEKKKTKELQKFISDAQLSAIVRQLTFNKMPKGELRGPPLSPTKLTYRTGRFVESIRVKQDQKKNIVKYYYMPLYRVHESSRPPSEIIEPSIREAVKALYGIDNVGVGANFNL